MGREVAGEYNFAYALGNLGVYLLWHGDVDEAQEKLEAALALAERTDDRYCQVWCQSNLLLVGVRRHDLESVGRCHKRRLPRLRDGSTLGPTLPSMRRRRGWRGKKVETRTPPSWPGKYLSCGENRGLCISTKASAFGP